MANGKFNRGRKNKALEEATDLTQSGAFADIVAPPRKEGDPTGQSTALDNQAGAISPVAEESLPSQPRQPMIPASPINLSTIPPYFFTAFTCKVNALFINSVTSSGGKVSDKEVKPRTSVKSIVQSFLSPPSFNNSGLFCNCCTCLGSR